VTFLAVSDAATRPIQKQQKVDMHGNLRAYTLRVYDAVGPESMSLLELLQKFSHYHGKPTFRPVNIDYRNMERVLNVASLGNLNRQFVSLLRSEQAAKFPILGDPTVWTKLLGENARLLTLKDAFAIRSVKRRFPYTATARWVWDNPRVIWPGLQVVYETLNNYRKGRVPRTLPKDNKTPPSTSITN
jgi:hypothetical protein